MGAPKRAQPTGRCVRGAIADQIELLIGDDEVRHTAIVFAEDYRSDPGLKAQQSPDLIARGEGVFVYEAAGRTAREVAVVLAEDGGAGPKAALQLLIQAAEALQQSRHGNLSPWHVLISGSGVVSLIGGQLPALDVHDYLADPELVPSLRTLRYCPPERLEGSEENLSSDMYSLVLVAAEVATGQPVYPGKRAAVLDLASAGDAGVRVRDMKLPEVVTDLFRAMLAPYAEDRAPVDAWLEAARAVLTELQGPDLSTMIAEAAKYLSDDEIDLPDGFELPAIEWSTSPEAAAGKTESPPEPQPADESEARPEPEPEPELSEAAQRAHTSADALSGLLLAARLAVDESLPAVHAALQRAEEQLTQAEASAEAAATSSGADAEGHAVRAAAHLSAGEALIDDAVVAQDKHAADRLDAAHGKARQALAIAEAAGAEASEVQALLDEALAATEPRDAERAASSAEALAAPLQKEALKKVKADFAALHRDALALDATHLVQESPNDDLLELQTALDAGRTALDLHREQRLEAALARFELAASTLRALGESPEPPPKDVIDLEHAATEAEASIETVRAARIATSIQDIEEAITTAESEALETKGLADQLAAAQKAAAPSEAAELAVAASTLLDTLRSEALQELAEELEALNAQATSLDLPASPAPEGLADRRVTVERLRVAIGLVRDERLAGARDRLQSARRSLAEHELDDASIDAHDASFAAETDVQKADVIASNAEAAAKAAISKAIDALSKDWATTTARAMALGVSIAKVPDSFLAHRNANDALVATIADEESERDADVDTRLQSLTQRRQALGLPEAPPLAHNDILAREEAIDALEVALVAESDVIATRVDKEWAATRSQGLLVRGVDLPDPPKDLAERIEALAALKQGVQKAVASRLKDAQQRAKAAVDALAKLKVPSHLAAAKKALALATKTTDVVAADDAATEAEDAVRLALSEHAEHAKTAWDEASAAATEAGVPVPTAPEATAALLQGALGLRAAVDQAHADRHTAAAARFRAAQVRIKARQTSHKPGKLPKGHSEAEATADAAEATATDLEAQHHSERSAVFMVLCDAIVGLGSTPSTSKVPEDPKALEAAIEVLTSQREVAEKSALSFLDAEHEALVARGAAISVTLPALSGDLAARQAAIAGHTKTVADAEAADLAAARKLLAEVRGRADAHNLPPLPQTSTAAEARAHIEQLEKGIVAAKEREAAEATRELDRLKRLFAQHCKSIDTLGLKTPTPPDNDVLADWMLAVASAESEVTSEHTARAAATAANFATLLGIADKLGFDVDGSDHGPTADENRALEASLRQHAIQQLRDLDAEARSYDPEASEHHVPDELDDVIEVISQATQQTDQLRLRRLITAQQRLTELVTQSGLPAAPHDGDDPAAVETATDRLRATWSTFRLEEAHETVVAARAAADARGVHLEPPTPPQPGDDPEAAEAAANEFAAQAAQACVDAVRAALKAAAKLATVHGAPLVSVPTSDDFGELDSVLEAQGDATRTHRLEQVDKRIDHLRPKAEVSGIGVPTRDDDPDTAEAQVAALEDAVLDARIAALTTTRNELQADAEGCGFELPAELSGPPPVQDLDRWKGALLQARLQVVAKRIATAKTTFERLRPFDDSLEAPQDDPDAWETWVAEHLPRVTQARLAQTQKGLRSIATEHPGPIGDRATGAAEASLDATSEEAAQDAEEVLCVLQAEVDAERQGRRAAAVAQAEQLLTRANATGDPREIDAAKQVLDDVRGASSADAAHAIALDAKRAVDDEPDAATTRSDGIARIDALQADLEQVLALLKQCPEPHGIEGTQAVEALRAVHPGPAIDAAREALEAPKTTTDVASARRLVDQAERAVAHATNAAPGLLDEAIAAFLVEDVVSIRDVVAEHFELDGVEPLMRATEAALRSARSARARGNSDALRKAHTAATVSRDRTHRLVAQAAAESGPDIASLDIDALTELLRAMTDESRRRLEALGAMATAGHQKAQVTIEEHALLGTLTLDIDEARAAAESARAALQTLPDAPADEPVLSPEPPDPPSRVRQLRRGRQHEGETAVDRLRSARRRRPDQNTIIHPGRATVDATIKLTPELDTTPAAAPRREFHDEMPLFTEDDPIFEDDDDSEEEDLKTMAYDDLLAAVDENTAGGIVLEETVPEEDPLFDEDDEPILDEEDDDDEPVLDEEDDDDDDEPVVDEPSNPEPLVVFEDEQPEVDPYRAAGATLAPPLDDDEPVSVPPRSRPASQPPISVESMADVYAAFEEPELAEIPDSTDGEHNAVADVEEVFAAIEERDESEVVIHQVPPPERIDIDMFDDLGASPTIEPVPDEDEPPTVRAKRRSARRRPTPPPASRTLISLEDEEHDDDSIRTVRVSLDSSVPNNDPQATVLFQRPAEPIPRPTDDDDKDKDKDKDKAGMTTKRLSVDSLRERLLARRRASTPPAVDRVAPPPDDYDPTAKTMILTPEALRKMVEEADDEDDDDPPSDTNDKTMLFYREGDD